MAFQERGSTFLLSHRQQSPFFKTISWQVTKQRTTHIHKEHPIYHFSMSCFQRHSVYNSKQITTPPCIKKGIYATRESVWSTISSFYTMFFYCPWCRNINDLGSTNIIQYISILWEELTRRRSDKTEGVISLYLGTSTRSLS